MFIETLIVATWDQGRTHTTGLKPAKRAADIDARRTQPRSSKRTAPGTAEMTHRPRGGYGF